MVIFNFTISLLLVKLILQPALILRDYVSNFSKGKFEVITQEFPQNEIGELADAYNSMARKISEMIEQVYNAEIEKSKHALAVKQAELHAMQMQITPHFIYNTLSTVSAHAIMIDNAAIQDMVNSLSSLMRYSLGKVWIPTTVEEEPNKKIQTVSFLFFATVKASCDIIYVLSQEALNLQTFFTLLHYIFVL